MKAFTETGFVFNYRFDAPNYKEIMEHVDALKVSLMHHNIPYRIFPGSEFMCFFLRHDDLEKCLDDETLKMRLDKLVKFTMENTK